MVFSQISYFSKNTPLNEDLLSQFSKNYGRTSEDDFVKRYLDTLRFKEKDRRRLVKDDPLFVDRAFTIFRDAQLGRLFVDEYADSQDFHHTAYFISVELGTPINRRQTNTY